jgi:large conductance mechanosensitive channel
LKGFRQFISRGNLIDLAVAVVIGTAFTALVTALVADIITPLIAAIAGKPNFGDLHFTIHHSEFAYGLFINAALSFLIVAAVLYYLIVAPAANIAARLNRHKAATERDCPECLSMIPVAARRCKYCTAEVAPLIGRRLPSADRSLGSDRGLAVPSPDVMRGVL